MGSRPPFPPSYSPLWSISLPHFRNILCSWFSISSFSLVSADITRVPSPSLFPPTKTAMKSREVITVLSRWTKLRSRMITPPSPSGRNLAFKEKYSYFLFYHSPLFRIGCRDESHLSSPFPPQSGGKPASPTLFPLHKGKDFPPLPVDRNPNVLWAVSSLRRMSGKSHFFLGPPPPPPEIDFMIFTPSPLLFVSNITEGSVFPFFLYWSHPFRPIAWR